MEIVLTATACGGHRIAVYLPLVHIATVYALQDAMPRGCRSLRDAIARYVLVLKWIPEHALLASMNTRCEKWSEHFMKSQCAVTPAHTIS